MDSIYENPDKEVCSSKWTKVLLIVLGVSLVLALGGLCVLGIMYGMQENNSTYGMQENNSTKQLLFYKAFTAQSLNSEMKLRDWGGKVYFFSSEKLNWTNSRDVCVSKGADLVTITSQPEQMFLFSEIKDQYWIGLNDLQTEGRWVWVNNQTLTETGVQFWIQRVPQKSEPDNWRVDDPNGENCAVARNFSDYSNSWSDISCNNKNKFICENIF